MLALVVIVCVTLVAVFSLEQFTLKPLAELLVEKATGRALSIEGGLDARAGRIVSIHAGGIRLANAEWSSSDDMLSIGEAEVSIDLMDIIDGRAAIDSVVVSSAKLLFEQDEQGRSNWAMGSDDAPAAAAEGGVTLIPIVKSQLSDIDITVKNAGMERPLEVRLDSVEHSARQVDRISATVVGAVDSRPLKLQARIGPLAELWSMGAVDIDIEAGFEGIALEVDGQLDDLLAPRQASVQVSVLSKEISQVFTTFGMPAIVSGETEVRASLQPSGDQHEIELTASIDTLTLDARARLRALDTIDGSSISLSAAGPDLAAAVRPAGLGGLPSQPFKIESSAALAGEHLTIGDSYFESGDNRLTVAGSMKRFPRIEDTNLKLQLVGNNYLGFAELLGITMPQKLKPEAFDVSAELAYSARDRQQFSARLTLADVNGEFKGKLTEYPSFVGSQLDYRLGGRNDGLLQQLLGRPTLVDGGYVLEGKLQRTGTGVDIERAGLTLGANELTVSGEVGDKPLQSDTDLSLRFSGPDLDKIAVIAGYTGFFPAGDAEIDAVARAQDESIQLDDLSIQLGDTRLKTSGVINLQDGLSGSRARVALAGKDITDLLPTELHSLVDPEQSFELTGSLRTDSQKLTINALEARMGQVNLDASGAVSMSQPLADLALKVAARGPDLAAVIPEGLLPYSVPATKFSVAGGVAMKENDLILDAIDAEIGDDRLAVSGTVPLDTPTDGLNLTIEARGPNLAAVVPKEIDQIEFAELPYDLSGKVSLADGFVSVQQLEYSTPRGHLAGQISVSISNPAQSGRFDLRAKGDNFSEFIPANPQFTPAAVNFAVDARGAWNGGEVNIELGDLKLGDNSIEIQGEIHLPPDPAATRLVLSAHGDKLADLGQFKGVNLPAEQFRVDAVLQGSSGSFEIPELDASIGDSDLLGSLRINLAEKPDIRIILDSDFFDLAQLLPAEDSMQAEDAGEAPTGSAISDGRLIPQFPVPADQLRKVNLETRIRLGELHLRHNTLKNIEFDSRLLEGDLTVSRLTAAANEGQITARFRALADGDRVVTSGMLAGLDIVLGKEKAGEEAQLPQLNLQLEFDTAGATTRELAANLNGFAQFTGGSGRLKNSLALGLFGDFFSELLSSINPFVTREPFTKIECFAAYAEIVDGVAEIKPGAVLQTDKLNMFASGQIDLNTELIGLRFDTGTREGIGISLSDFVNPFVGVSGTLASPGLGVDPKNAMFEGGFAYATGGLSIVGKSLFNRWFGASDPCGNLQQEAQKYLEEKETLKEKPTVKQ